MPQTNAHSLDDTYLAALHLIHDRIAGASLDWALTGSVAFALRGLDFSSPGDIDLQTDTAGAYVVEQRLAEYSVRPVHISQTERIRSHFGALQIEGVTVEIMGDIQHKRPDGTWTDPVDIPARREWVEVDGLRLPLLSLAYEAEAYRRIGRPETARRLRAWMAGREQDEHRSAKGDLP